ncbi:MAG: 50S ribosomal protein L13 [Myxococcota bacterium]
MKTPLSNHGKTQRQWHLIDAKGLILGRLVTRIAHLLRGKHNPKFVPHEDTGDHVIVINARHVKVSGGKESQKLYWRHSGYPGGERSTTLSRLRKQSADRIIQHATKGMLPKGPLGRQTLQKLKIYLDERHPHQSQHPTTVVIEKTAVVATSTNGAADGN